MEQTTETITPPKRRRFARKPAEAANTPQLEPRAGRKAKAVPPADSNPAPRITKADAVFGLLARTGGATIAQMCEATGWQQHSMRGFLAGTVKKKAGVTLTSEKADGVRTYRITAEGASR